MSNPYDLSTGDKGLPDLQNPRAYEPKPVCSPASKRAIEKAAKKYADVLRRLAKR